MLIMIKKWKRVLIYRLKMSKKEENKELGILRKNIANGQFYFGEKFVFQWYR